MKLTHKQIIQEAPGPKDRKLFDGKGLYLLLTPAGGKYWRMKYRYGGKEKTVSLGTFPTVSLKEARKRLEEQRKLLFDDNKDPATAKRLSRAAQATERELTFEFIAREWIDNNQKWSDPHRARVLKSLEVDAFPYIGAQQITDITPPDMLSLVRRVESRDALELASRILQRCTSVFRYAIQTGRATYNPATELRGALKTRKVQHVASLPASELPELVEAIESYEGFIVTRYALKFLLLTFVRPGELRGARWDEIHLDDALWRIPAERMKMDTEHLAPLSRQALAILEEMQELTGTRDLIFHGEQSWKKPMSENTLSYALHRMGFKGRATPHGFRATASSVLNEQGFNPDAIERQLSHIERNNVRAAYSHHARWLKERREMMQWWADYLEAL